MAALHVVPLFVGFRRIIRAARLRDFDNRFEFYVLKICGRPAKTRASHYSLQKPKTVRNCDAIILVAAITKIIDVRPNTLKIQLQN